LCEDPDKAAAAAKDAHFQACAPVPLEESNELKVDQQEEGWAVAQMQGVLLNEGQARRIAQQNALLAERAETIKEQTQRIGQQDQQLAIQARELDAQKAEIAELQQQLAAQKAQSNAQQARLDAQAEEMRQIRQMMLAMRRGL
jgi:septal ring factor EnvC (AmiA/AmiB activator)